MWIIATAFGSAGIVDTMRKRRLVVLYLKLSSRRGLARDTRFY